MATPLTHKLESYTFCIKSNSLSDNISAPTQSLLQKWLREEHSLHMEIFLSDNSPYTGYYYRVMTIGQYFTTSHDGILSDKFEYALKVVAYPRKDKYGDYAWSVISKIIKSKCADCICFKAWAPS